MSQGMDLRDYFAGQALNLFATDRFLNDDDLLQWAQFSYRVADAMLKARENKHE